MSNGAGAQDRSVANRSHTLVNPYAHSLMANITYAAKRGLPMVAKGDRSGIAVVCGTGPTLLEPANLAKVRKLVAEGATVYAVKDGVRVLREHGVRCDFSVAIDPCYLQILKTPVHTDVTYCLASSCHPALYSHVLGHGARVEVFHSICGVEDEDLWYHRLFGTTDKATGGYTVANRAAWLALYRGHSTVYVAGVPFGWRQGSAYYAAGVQGKAGNLGSVYTADARLDGRAWHTKLDMLASAFDLHFLIRRGKVRMIGESIAQSMARKPLDFVKEHVFDKPHLTARPDALNPNPAGTRPAAQAA